MYGFYILFKFRSRYQVIHSFEFQQVKKIRSLKWEMISQLVNPTINKGEKEGKVTKQKPLLMKHYTEKPLFFSLCCFPNRSREKDPHWPEAVEALPRQQNEGELLVYMKTPLLGHLQRATTHSESLSMLSKPLSPLRLGCKQRTKTMGCFSSDPSWSTKMHSITTRLTSLFVGV